MTGPKFTDEQREENLQKVDDAISSGWSVQKMKALSLEFGVTRRQVRKYYEKVLARRAKERGKRGPKKDVERFLSDVEKWTNKAAQADQFGAVMSGMNIQAKVLGLEKPTEHLHKHKGGKTTVIISREYPDLGESG